MLALLIALSTILPTTLYLYHEYLAFRSLGPGGTPQTPAGFIKVFLLSFAQLSNPFELPQPPSTTTTDRTTTTGSLHNLSPRRGPRPQTRGIAPHRQTTQQGTPATHALLTARLADLAAHAPHRYYTATSCFEPHSAGLFAHHPRARGNAAPCGAEVCHSHPSDGGSMHLTLAAGDAWKVLERGWGERHPLARGGWFERFVPKGFVMVYAPRDEGEVEVVVGIVRAAGWFVGRGGSG